MKFSWLLALKIILVLFWVVGIVFLWIAGVESKESIIYLYHTMFCFNILHNQIPFGIIISLDLFLKGTL